MKPNGLITYLFSTDSSRKAGARTAKVNLASYRSNRCGQCEPLQHGRDRKSSQSIDLGHVTSTFRSPGTSPTTLPIRLTRSTGEIVLSRRFSAYLSSISSCKPIVLGVEQTHRDLSPDHMATRIPVFLYPTGLHTHPPVVYEPRPRPIQHFADPTSQFRAFGNDAPST